MTNSVISKTIMDIKLARTLVELGVPYYAFRQMLNYDLTTAVKFDLTFADIPKSSFYYCPPEQKIGVSGYDEEFFNSSLDRYRIYSTRVDAIISIHKTLKEAKTVKKAVENGYPKYALSKIHVYLPEGCAASSTAIGSMFDLFLDGISIQNYSLLRHCLSFCGLNPELIRKLYDLIDIRIGRSYPLELLKIDSRFPVSKKTLVQSLTRLLQNNTNQTIDSFQTLSDIHTVLIDNGCSFKTASSRVSKFVKDFARPLVIQHIIPKMLSVMSLVSVEQEINKFFSSGILSEAAKKSFKQAACRAVQIDSAFGGVLENSPASVDIKYIKWLSSYLNDTDLKFAIEND